MMDNKDLYETMANIAASWWSSKILEKSNTLENCDKSLIKNRMVGYFGINIDGFNGFQEDLKNAIKEELQTKKVISFKGIKVKGLYLATKDGFPVGVLQKITKKYGLDHSILPDDTIMIIADNKIFYKGKNSHKINYLYNNQVESHSIG